MIPNKQKDAGAILNISRPLQSPESNDYKKK